MAFNLISDWLLDVLGRPMVAAAPASTFRTNAGTVGDGQSILSYTSQGNVSFSIATTIPLGTLPANKNWFVTDISIKVNQATPFLAQLSYNSTPTTTATWLPFWEGEISSTDGVNLVGLESELAIPATAQIALQLAAPAGASLLTYHIAGTLQ